MKIPGTALLAPLLAALVTAHAAEVPDHWDLTFNAIKDRAPPAAPGTEHCSKLANAISLQTAQIQSFMARVPLEKFDEAVLVQDSWHRYGVFIGAGRAYAIANVERDFSIHEVSLAEARDVVRQYAQHDHPSGLGLLSDVQINQCSSLPAAAVSLLHEGQARQFWLSGWDFAETLGKWRGADLLGVLLLGGNGSGKHQEARWAETLSARIHHLARSEP